jgi:hypothetical protein
MLMCCGFAIMASLFPRSSAYGHVVAYHPLHDSNLSGSYVVTVDEQPVTVQRYNGNSYVWFAFSGTVTVRVALNEPVGRYQLSPKHYQIHVEADGSVLSFQLDRPRKLVLRNVNALTEELFMFADPLEHDPPVPGSPDVINVREYLDDRPGIQESRDAFQRAVDVAAARPDGGVVYVPEGRYHVSQTVFLKSNVHLYLAPGALVEVPGGVACCFEHGSVFRVIDARNIRISGRGAIHGQGTTQSAFFWLLTAANVDALSVEDILLIDGYTTALRLQHATRSSLRNLKILSDSPRLSDGIDIDSSQNVTVDGCFVYSSDDSTALGAGSNEGEVVESTEFVVVKNSVFYQTRTGHTFYIAPHIAPPYIRNILYDNNDVVSVAGAVGIYPFGGVKIEAVVFKDIRVEEVREEMPISLWIGDCTSWGPQNCGRPYGVLGHIHDVHFDNVTIDNYGGQNSILQGHSTASDIDKVHFTNLTIAGNLITDPSLGRFTILGHVSNVSFSAPGVQAGAPGTARTSEAGP